MAKRANPIKIRGQNTATLMSLMLMVTIPKKTTTFRKQKTKKQTNTGAIAGKKTEKSRRTSSDATRRGRWARNGWRARFPRVRPLTNGAGLDVLETVQSRLDRVSATQHHPAAAKQLLRRRHHHHHHRIDKGTGVGARTCRAAAVAAPDYAQQPRT